MSEILRLSGNAFRLLLIILLGASLAGALYPLWDLDTRWLVVTVVAIAGFAFAMCFIHMLSDFLMIVLLFSLPIMSFQKWFWPARYTDAEHGELVYAGVIGIGPLDFLLLGFYATWFHRIFVTREQKLPGFTLLDGAILWFLLAHFVSSIGSPAADLALNADVFLCKFVLFYFYASRNLTARMLPWLVGAFCSAILLEAMLGTVQFATGKLLGIALDKGAGGSELNAQYAVPGIEGIYRATGTCYDSHSLGHFMALLLPFPLVLCFTPRLKPAPRLLFLAAGTLAAMILVLSQSRSAWLATAIALPVGVVLIITIWQERQVIPALAVGAFLLALAAPVAGGFIYQRFANAPPEVLGMRYDQYWVALAIIGHFPIFGQGPGNWFESMAHYDYLWIEEDLPVHNVLLWLTADLGLVGVLGYLCIFAVAARRLLGVIRGRRDLAARLAMATLIALIATLLDGLTDPTFREPNVFTLFWLLIALGFLLPGLPAGTGEHYLQPPGPAGQKEVGAT